MLVFSKDKCMEDLTKKELSLFWKIWIRISYYVGWINWCDELTESQMNKFGKLTHKDWMIVK